MKELVLKKYCVTLEAIEEYCKFSMHERRLPIVKNQGLNVFLQIPQVICASLYLLNEETFEFYHDLTLPAQDAELCSNIFQVLVDKGVIGDALKNVSISYEQSEFTFFDNSYSVAVPLLKADGVIGIIILRVDTPPEKLGQTFFLVCNIHSGLFAITLENVLLHINQLENLDTLEQMVAFRTMNLVKSKKQLADKFEDLQSNLSMALPHEFRTPINQIIGTVDFLINYYDKIEYNEAKEVLNDAKLSAERLRRLTENYLFYANLSLISSDMFEILNLQKQVTTSIYDTLNDKSVMLSQKYSRENDISLSIVDVPISISEEYFSKIVEELIDNALKYSDKGTIVKIMAIIDNNYLSIQIIDSGRGFTEEQISQVDAYMQFERKIYEQQGSGLGLSIVIKLIDLHNGDFKIDSKPNAGTTITIRIPIAS